MEFTLEYFANDRYRVLSYLSTQQVEVSNQMVVVMTQQELADNLHMSKLKVNEIMVGLVDGGFVDVPKRGRYRLTEKGVKVLRLIQKKNV